MYSTLQEIEQQRDIIDAFGGYNHNLRINDGEFYEMRNLTSTYFPVLSPRNTRGTYIYPDGSEDGHSPNGLVSKDALCYADGTTFYVNNAPITGLILTDTKKDLISMGAYVIIMPDKKYVNTADLTYGDIEATFTTTESVNYSLCDIDGEEYTDTQAGDKPPEIKEGETPPMWVDTSSSPHCLKQYNSVDSSWVQIPTTYVKISSANIAKMFKQYDGVRISGIDTSVVPGLKDFDGKYSVLYEAHHEVSTDGGTGNEVSSDYIVIKGIIDHVGTQSAPLTIERRMPKTDFIIESNNRLWGCRYGVNNDGETVNEIYASKLGDFKNWNCFMGISTDSYAVSCGSDGQWTGAITHLGYPLFFKENFLHKIYGNFPSNFQVQTTACRGVMKGAGNSLAIVNECLYYKSRSGVCAYDGSLPTEISSAFGDIRYSAVDETVTDEWYLLRNGAAAGSHHNKYYISQRSEADGKWYLFVYDTLSGMWHKEDETRADCFCSCRGELYYIDHDKKAIRTVFGSGARDAEPTEWMAETGIITYPQTQYGNGMMPDKKYISRIIVRMQMEIGSRVMFYAQYDSCGQWEHLATLQGMNVRSFAFPIKPKRCDHFRLRIEGIGGSKIFSVARVFERGSDR